MGKPYFELEDFFYPIVKVFWCECRYVDDDGGEEIIQTYELSGFLRYNYESLEDDNIMRRNIGSNSKLLDRCGIEHDKEYPYIILEKYYNGDKIEDNEKELLLRFSRLRYV
jgi:hypothetical protein